MIVKKNSVLKLAEALEKYREILETFVESKSEALDRLADRENPNPEKQAKLEDQYDHLASALNDLIVLISHLHEYE
jgi:Mg2+ and Co2+ transporter CorA